MRDIRQTVEAVYRLALYDPRTGRYRKPSAHYPDLVEQIYAEIHSYAVDQLLSIANAMSPESEAETVAVAWLNQHLVAIAQQLPNPKKEDQSDRVQPS